MIPKTKCLNEKGTIGKLVKRVDWYKVTNGFKCVGRLDVKLLKEYVSHLKDDDVIGVYIDKNNNLSPLHSRGWLMCPMITEEATRIKEFKETNRTKTQVIAQMVAENI